MGVACLGYHRPLSDIDSTAFFPVSNKHRQGGQLRQAPHLVEGGGHCQAPCPSLGALGEAPSPL